MDRLERLISYYNPSETDFGLTRYQMDWLITTAREQRKELERLRTVEQAYQALLSATAGQQK